MPSSHVAHSAPSSATVAQVTTVISGISDDATRNRPLINIGVLEVCYHSHSTARSNQSTLTSSIFPS